MLNRHKKTIVPILILCIVVGIWIFKNKSETTTPVTSNKVNSASEEATQAETAVAEDLNDVAKDAPEELNATFLDLEELKSYGLPIMIDFGADTCVPCKEMAPVLKEINEAYRGKVIVKFVDVRKYPKLSRAFPVRVIPTQFFFDKDGKPFMPKDPVKMGMQIYETENSKQHLFTSHEGGLTKEQILAIFSELGVEQ